MTVIISSIFVRDLELPEIVGQINWACKEPKDKRSQSSLIGAQKEKVKGPTALLGSRVFYSHTHTTTIWNWALAFKLLGCLRHLSIGFTTNRSCCHLGKVFLFRFKALVFLFFLFVPFSSKTLIWKKVLKKKKIARKRAEFSTCFDSDMQQNNQSLN